MTKEESNIHEWISVKDFLPKMNEFTLIYYGGKVPLIGCYKGDGMWLGADSDFWTIKDEVTYWMPLPLLPKDHKNYEL